MTERERWTNEAGEVTNVELVAGSSEIWLDGPVRDWPQRFDPFGCWVGILTPNIDAVHADLLARGHDVDAPADGTVGISV